MIIRNIEELNKYNELDFYLSCDLLDIDITNIDKHTLTCQYIKKKYHELSLKYHPDKNNNSIFSKSYFQKIKEAYDYLTIICNEQTQDEININDSYNKTDTYSDILTTFINSILKSNYKEDNYKEIIINIIKQIAINYEHEITCKLFEDLDKDTSIEVYQFLVKYNRVLHISNVILTNIYDCIRSKFKDASVYILNPTIDDLLDNNIYKLNIEGKIYPVPLWHNELYFDSPEGEIIVLNNPELPENVTVDEHNNLSVVINISFDDELLNEKKITFNLGKRKYEIQCERLCIKKMQYFVFKREGISKIIENDIYNVSSKGDITVKIIFYYPIVKIHLAQQHP